MKYHSTRDASLHYDSSQVIMQGLSEKGDYLYPKHFQHFRLKCWKH